MDADAIAGLPGPPSVADATPEAASEIRDLMAGVIARDVTQDPDLLADTLANVNANVDFWLEAPQRCVHLVARHGGRIVGVVLVKDYWNLCSLFVASDMQGRGVGRLLVEAAAARCRGRSDRQALCLNAATAAIPFYRRLGFTPRAPARPLPPGFQAMQRALPGGTPGEVP
jgi:GNAT superfamily N-acetyltransferase